MDDQNDVKADSSPVEADTTPQAEAESAPEVPEPAQAEEAPEPPKEEVKTEDAPKKGAQSRIKELVADKKAAEEKAQSLEEKLAELTSPVGPQVPQIPYKPQVDSNGEVTIDQVLAQARTETDLRVRQSEAVQRINTEAGQAVRKYPQLDPESDQFDAELSDSVTEATMAYVKAEPYSASPKKFVDKMMKPYLRAVTKEVGKASENIAKQVSQAALRPTAVSTKGEKSPQEKSLKELENELGFYN